jgi:hypothetical protein
VTPEKYRETLFALEQQWADEISARTAQVAAVIHPLSVSDRYLRRLIEDSDITRAHVARVEELEVAFYS